MTPEIPAEVKATLERARADIPDLPDPTTGVTAGRGPGGPEPEPATNGHDEPPGSLIAELRAQHRRIGQRKNTIIELPYGLWAGKLAVRYHLLDERALSRMMKAVQTAEGEALLEANADILIGGCDEVVARRDTDEPWGPIVPGEHFKFDQRLAEALQLGPADGARQVLYGLYGGRVEGALAINDQAGDYIAWAQGKTPEVVSELEGESQGRAS